MIYLLTLLLCLLLPVQSWAAVAFVNNGAAAGQVSTVSLAFPASITAGNLLVVCVGNKYPTNGPALPTDAYGGTWVAPSNNQGSGDPGDGPGVDVGAVYGTVFYKVATGSETGNLSVVATGSNSIYGFIAQYTNATGVWDLAAANGGDASSGTAWSATMGTDPGIVGSDIVVACSGKNNDAASATVEALAQTGVTFGAMTERLDNGTSQGDDSGAVFSEHPVTSITTPSGSVVYTMTTAANTAGGTTILRLRESAASTVLQSPSGYLGGIIK